MQKCEMCRKWMTKNNMARNRITNTLKPGKVGVARTIVVGGKFPDKK